MELDGATLQKLANSLRILSADMVERAGSGHPGMPLGMADIFTVLFAEIIKFYPSDPKWPNRDRLILSNGHGSALLYSLLFFLGYEDCTLAELKNFRQLGSKTAGHPEFGLLSGIEATTGPLGQGLANAVGMAIAQKKMQTRFDFIDHKIFVTVGDGCLMEGISHESCSLAGHFGLNNLVVLFDCNYISIDGSTDLATSDNHRLRFISYGFEVFIVDGHDFAQISEVLQQARNEKEKPVLIIFETMIGYGCDLKENTEKAHGAPLGNEEIKALRENCEWSHPPFEFPDDILQLWREIGSQYKDLYQEWLKKAEPKATFLDNFINKRCVSKVADRLNKHKQEIVTGIEIFNKSDEEFQQDYQNLTQKISSIEWENFTLQENLNQELIDFFKQYSSKIDKEFAADHVIRNLNKIYKKKYQNSHNYTEINQKFEEEFSKKEHNLENLTDFFAQFDSTIDFQFKPESTRKSFGKIMSSFQNPHILGGSADLSESNCTINSNMKIINMKNFAGNYIHFGVREQGMAGIMNGLALYGGYLPYGGTFLIFSDYCKAGIRLSALMKQQVIYVMTHDSIGLGEDGPTHQPIEQLAGLRAMPNLLVLRPADFIETLECVQIAINSKKTPSFLVLSRQNLPQLRNNQNIDAENLSAKGAYILQNSTLNSQNPQMVIYASGSELQIAMEIQKILEHQHKISVEVISVVSFELFDQQNQEYKDKILHHDNKNILKIAIEAASGFGWEKFIGSDGSFFGMNSFGASGKAKDLFEYFELTAEKIVQKILTKL